MNLFVFLILRLFPSDPDHLYSLILSKANLVYGNYACLLTSGFVHLTWGHLFANMLGILIFGRIVEQRFGFFKTLLIYVSAQMIAMLSAIIIYNTVFHVDRWIVGASGGLMGLIGCAMLLDPFCITYETLFPIPMMIKGWMFIYADLRGFLGGERDGVSHLTHLMGILSVAVVIYFLNKKERQKMKEGLLVNVSFIIMFAVMNWWVAWR